MLPVHANDYAQFREANAANGWTGDSASTGYTWHHSHELRRRGGKVQIKMQLVVEDVHDWTKHAGGIAIGKQILGKSACR